MNSIVDVSAPAAAMIGSVVNTPCGSGAPSRRSESSPFQTELGQYQSVASANTTTSAPDCSAATADATDAPNRPARSPPSPTMNWVPPPESAGASGKCRPYQAVRSVSVFGAMPASPSHTGSVAGKGQRRRTGSGSVARVLQLGFRLELYRSAELRVPFDLVRLAEDLGFHSVWTAEAYGSDALSPLAALAPATSRIKLGTAVVQLAGRPPATLGMQAMTIDALAGGGRMIIGIGVSGPQIVEGWYGQPWGKPNARLRDYITILRQVIAREGPVTHDGPEISLPYTGPGALGQGKPLKSILHSPSDIPIWLASVGPRNTELCAELCDGWLPMGLPAGGHDRELPTSSMRGSPDERLIARATSSRCSPDSPSTSPTTCKGWLDSIRPYRATYVGGMGSESHNYHVESMAKRGFADDAARIQELFLAGRREEAIAAMPDEACCRARWSARPRHPRSSGRRVASCRPGSPA